MPGGAEQVGVLEHGGDCGRVVNGAAFAERGAFQKVNELRLGDCP